MSNTGEKMKEGIHDAAEKVKDAGHKVAEKTKAAAHDVGQKIKEATHSVAEDQGRCAQRRREDQGRRSLNGLASTKQGEPAPSSVRPHPEQDRTVRSQGNPKGIHLLFSSAAGQ